MNPTRKKSFENIGYDNIAALYARIRLSKEWACMIMSKLSRFV
jgi:hypothetical protein